MPKKCTERQATGLTPRDGECHNHVSNTQQQIHNLHCRFLACPHALKGTERHADAPTHPPRKLMENFFKKGRVKNESEERVLIYDIT